MADKDKSEAPGNEPGVSPKKAGRPARELGHWGAGEYETLLKYVRLMETGYNTHSRDTVDKHAEAIIALVNKQRGMK
jgi:hypothetical protein